MYYAHDKCIWFMFWITRTVGGTLKWFVSSFSYSFRIPNDRSPTKWIICQTNRNIYLAELLAERHKHDTTLFQIQFYFIIVVSSRLSSSLNALLCITRSSISSSEARILVYFIHIIHICIFCFYSRIVVWFRASWIWVWLTVCALKVHKLLNGSMRYMFEYAYFQWEEKQIITVWEIKHKDKTFLAPITTFPHFLSM